MDHYHPDYKNFVSLQFEGNGEVIETFSVSFFITSMCEYICQENNCVLEFSKYNIYDTEGNQQFKGQIDDLLVNQIKKCPYSSIENYSYFICIDDYKRTTTINGHGVKNLMIDFLLNNTQTIGFNQRNDLLYHFFNEIQKTECSDVTRFYIETIPEELTIRLNQKCILPEPNY